MQPKRVLKAGLFVMIEVAPGENWPFAIGFISDDFKRISCELLMDRPDGVPVESGKELVVSCQTDGGIYKFPAKIAEMADEPFVLTLELIQDATHIQRREFFRLSRPMVRAKYLPVGGPEDIFEENLREAPVQDLSGNGIALIISKDDALPGGMPIRTEIELGNGRTISLVGEVARCIPDQPFRDKSLLCIHFSLIEERDRDRIIGYLFREQLDRAGRRRQIHGRS